MDVLTWWKWLDTHPEPAWRELATTEYLVDVVRGMGLEARTFADHTGLIVEVGTGPHTTAVRADIDAVWFGEADTGHALHACGHSAHMAIALGALDEIRHEAPTWNRSVRFLFQPAEELGEGAKRFTELGALDGVDIMFGMHLRPAAELPTGFAPAIQGGASQLCSVELVGSDAHGARPQEGRNVIDPILAIGALLKSIYFPPGDSWSAKLTRIRSGGESRNVIPGFGELAIDCRTETNALMRDLTSRIETGVASVAETYGVDATLTWEDGTPAAQVGDVASGLLRDAIVSVAGPAALHPRIVTPGADDFHFYTAALPEMSGAMLAVGCQLEPGLHSPAARYDVDVLPQAAKVLADAIRRSADVG